MLANSVEDYYEEDERANTTADLPHHLFDIETTLSPQQKGSEEACLLNFNKFKRVYKAFGLACIRLQALVTDPMMCRFLGQIEGNLLAFSENTNALASVKEVCSFQ